jgi:hypothetical protein
VPALQEAARGGVISYAARPHYADHLAPVLARLPADLDVALVASYKDLTIARRTHRRIVLMQHGAGQSYSNDNPAYPGGADNDAVGLFLVPGEHAAARWRSAYPRARVEVVGSPRLDDLPPREAGPLTVALSWHWNGFHTPESQSSFPWYRQAVPEIAREFRVIGHGHPRRKDLPAFYAKHGIEYVPTFEEVCRRADVYVCDNSSTIFEFAATGRPVVLMNAPIYRKGVSHGLRYWDAADVGVQVDHAPDLLPAIRRALEHRPEDIAAREDALESVYTYRHGAAQRAADTIMEWAA